ncbi:MAG: AAA family ATPase, partial [Byssovorax sp.]
LAGALSFGRTDRANAHFGQLLTNIKHDQAMAFLEAHREGLAPKQQDVFTRLAASRQRMIDTIARALSDVLLRTVTIEFQFGQQAPVILLDGEQIPFDLLGEGMRSTLAWLADLLVRLHRISWANPEISPLEQDFWLILDEIDESLHPTMQMRILPALRHLFPNARMYVTTHSPFVVASAGEGYVFSINPDARHRVSGTIEARRLEPGQSLEWVVEEVFGAETGFIDPWTRDALRAHRADINRLRRKEDLGGEGWRAFLTRRAKLMHLNEQVQTVVAMQEVPVQSVVEAKAASAA